MKVESGGDGGGVSFLWPAKKAHGNPTIADVVQAVEQQQAEIHGMKAEI